MTTSETGDPIYEELVKLDHSIAAPSEMIKGVDLTQFVMPDGKSAFERYNEIIGEEGKLRAKLEKKIMSESYQKLTDPYRFDEKNFYKGGKISELESIVKEHRDFAIEKLFREKPVSKENKDLDLENAIFNNQDNRVDWNGSYKKNVNDLFQIK